MSAEGGPGRKTGTDPAVLHARRVLGLYGDPDVSWSIVLACTFAVPREAGAVAAAVAALTSANPHLGRPAELRRYSSEQEDEVLAGFADTVYGDRDPLLRVALSEDGRTLLVAAHHGAVDGLGLLGACSVLADAGLTSSAAGIERGAEPQGFVRASIGRLGEALVRPPVRLAARRESPEATGDWLACREVQTGKAGSGALLMSAVASVRRWNTEARRRRRSGARVVIAMGLSRRPGTPTPSPDRDTAYVRLVADQVTSTAAATELVRRTVPEPAFPVTDGGGLAPRLVRLLSGRLGSTLLVSNLGLVRGEDLVSVRFWPVPAGPAGTAIGLASTAHGTNVTVRLRRGWFSRADAATFVELVSGELVRASRGPDEVASR